MMKPFKSIARRHRSAWFLLLMMAFGTGGCAGPGYYVQAVSGHWHLMRGRSAIDELLENPQIDSHRAQQLRSAQGILEFAESELQLPADGSYQSFVETGREAVVWNVVAAPEFSLTPRKWCFIVAGCVPYRGYFEHQDALQFSAKLERKGLDSSVSPAGAYSTLGWFSDPLLDTMLNRSDWQLAGYLFHELAHRKLYVRGDTDFNEAYARHVEQIGVDAWLRQTANEIDRQQWEKTTEATADFRQLLAGGRAELEQLYRSDISESQMRHRKLVTLEQLRSDYQSMLEQRWDGRNYFGSWFDKPLNNARMALLNSYEGGHCAFSRLFDQAQRDPARFHALAKKMAALKDDERTRWLKQPCDAVASSGHL